MRNMNWHGKNVSTFTTFFRYSLLSKQCSNVQEFALPCGSRLQRRAREMRMNILSNMIIKNDLFYSSRTLNWDILESSIRRIAVVDNIGPAGSQTLTHQMVAPCRVRQTTEIRYLLFSTMRRWVSDELFSLRGHSIVTFLWTMAEPKLAVPRVTSIVKNIERGMYTNAEFDQE